MSSGDLRDKALPSPQIRKKRGFPRQDHLKKRQMVLCYLVFLKSDDMNP